MLNIYKDMSLKDAIARCEGFEWDEANLHKNWDKHDVTFTECEQLFFNIPLLLADDLAHGDDEDRFIALGRTGMNRKIFLIFSIRSKLIRVISARDMTKNERATYETHK